MPENLLSLGAVQGWLIRLIFIAPAVLLAVTFHEFAHGGVANLLGDRTAKDQGRLSLNPLRHLDPLGTILFVLFHFGWGKPVPVDGSNLRWRRWGMAAVSLAGPATNFLLAGIFGLALKSFSLPEPLVTLVALTAQINIILGVFNLLPLPPLDGSRIVAAVLPGRLRAGYNVLEGYGVAVLFIVIWFFPGALGRILGPFIDFFGRLLLV